MKQWVEGQLVKFIEENEQFKGLDLIESLLDVSTSENELSIKIKSDNLKFAQKLSLERYLEASLNESFPEMKLLVSFRKTSANTSKNSSPKPADKEETGKLGVKKQTQAIPGVSKIIAVSSGKGGVGKSTVSSNLAVSLANLGHKVGLLDADIYGPSAPLMFGLEGSMQVASGNRIVPRENYGVKIASIGFLAEDAAPVIWRGPVVSGVLKQLMYETVWGGARLFSCRSSTWNW